MSVVKKLKRKPFGTIAGNVLASKKRPSHKTVRHSSKSGSAPSSLEPSPRHGKRKHPLEPIESKHGAGRRASASSTRVDNNKHKAAVARKKQDAKASKRRDSKTPKAGNLSTAAGAYDLSKEVDLCEPRHQKNKLPKKVVVRLPTAKPDPSPIKRPDPTSFRSRLPRTNCTSKPKNHGANKQDNFVSASLKRLFPSKNMAKRRTSAKPTKNARPDKPIDPVANDSDMDTVCSTPEKDSPFLKSPFAKLDPIAKDTELGRKEDSHDPEADKRVVDDAQKNDHAKHTDHDAKKRTASSSPEKDSPLIRSPLTKLDPIAEGNENVVKLNNNEMIGKGNVDQSDKHDATRGLEEDKNTNASKAPGMLQNSHKIVIDQHENDPCIAPQVKAAREPAAAYQQRKVTIEALDQARNGPTDNKRVLRAMFSSGKVKPGRSSKTTEKEALIESLLGSFIGLQRSNSVDESEVTEMDYIEELSKSSMTTRADTVRDGSVPYRSASSRSSISASDIFRSKAPSHDADNKGSNGLFHQDLRRANAIGAQTNHVHIPTQLQHTRLPLTQLPAGWRVKWSKTKQKPYYVHPDFGSTWFCPGLVSPEPVVSRNEVSDNQRVFLVGKHTSNVFEKPKSITASNMTRSTYTVSTDMKTKSTRGGFSREYNRSNAAEKSIQSSIGESSCSMSKRSGPSHMAHSTYTSKQSFGGTAEEKHRSMAKSCRSNMAESEFESNVDLHSCLMRGSAGTSHMAHSTYTSEKSIDSNTDGYLRSMAKSIGTSHNMSHRASTVGSTFESYKSVDASHIAHYTQTARLGDGDVGSSFKSDIDDVETGAEVARELHGKDVSSADVSSGCLTQDFGSNDGVASSFGHDDDESKNAKENQNEREDPTEGDHPEQQDDRDNVAFDHDQGGGFDEQDDVRQEKNNNEDSILCGTKQGGGIDESDGESRERFNDDMLERPRSSTDENDNLASDLGMKANTRDEINSLASDHVDVDALLRHGSKKLKNQSPLATIKESYNDSDACQLSEVSRDDKSINDGAGLKVLQNDQSLETLSHASDTLVESTTIHVASNRVNVKDNNVNDHGGGDDYDQSPMFENNDVGNDDFDNPSHGEFESVEIKSQTKDETIAGSNLDKEFKKESKARTKKNMFPPGGPFCRIPLCSLQFLEDKQGVRYASLEKDRMKRRRSSLTSGKRSKTARRKDRRKSFS